MSRLLGGLDDARSYNPSGLRIAAAAYLVSALLDRVVRLEAARAHEAGRREGYRQGATAAAVARALDVDELDERRVEQESRSPGGDHAN